MTPYVLASGEGRAFWFGTMFRVEKAETATTAVAFAMSEVTADAGYPSPPHVHSREDEALYVDRRPGRTRPQPALTCEQVVETVRKPLRERLGMCGCWCWMSQ